MIQQHHLRQRGCAIPDQEVITAAANQGVITAKPGQGVIAQQAIDAIRGCTSLRIVIAVTKGDLCDVAELIHAQIAERDKVVRTGWRLKNFGFNTRRQPQCG